MFIKQLYKQKHNQYTNIALFKVQLWSKMCDDFIQHPENYDKS